MLTLNCPACGAEVPFHSKASVFAVCSYCRSSLVRSDKDLKAIGKMAELQDELTPLQVGTKGVYEDKPFEVIGRLRIGYSDGFWNEWYTLFADGREAWIAEAQGFWAMCMKAVPAAMPERSQLRPGVTVDMHPYGSFTVEDMRDVRCVYSEGELPVAAAAGRTSTSVDLATGDGRKMATIEYAADERRVFVGAYLDFDEFKFRNLRQLDGW